jgi:hypothetical protein
MTTTTLESQALNFHGSLANSTTAPASKKRLWTGRILSGLVGVLLLFDSAVKLLQAAPAMQGTMQLGYPSSVVFPLGLVLLACVALYLVPRTAVVGAVLLTGYLGGAVATHVRVGDPLFTHVLAPIYVAVLIWGGLYLRDRRVRALIGPRQA